MAISSDSITTSKANWATAPLKLSDFCELENAVSRAKNASRVVQFLMDRVWESKRTSGVPKVEGCTYFLVSDDEFEAATYALSHLDSVTDDLSKKFYSLYEGCVARNKMDAGGDA